MGPQIANPQIATLAEGPKICGTYLRTAHLRLQITKTFKRKKRFCANVGTVGTAVGSRLERRHVSIREITVGTAWVL
jgi:hypothetical protein